MFWFPADTPFWYIRNLCFIIVIFPAILAVLRWKRFSMCLLICFLCIYLCLCLCDLPSNWQFFSIYGLSFRSLCFSFLGAYVAFYPRNFQSSKLMTAVILAAWLVMVFLASKCQLTIDCNNFMKYGTLRLQILLGGLGMWFLYDHIPALAKLGDFYAVKNHFFIYAAHYGIMGVLFCNKSQQLMTNVLGRQTVLFYAARITVTFAICIGIIMLLKKYKPSWLAFLCGGRA